MKRYNMKKKYNEIEIEIYTFQDADIITASISGSADGDETKYPILDGWANNG